VRPSSPSLFVAQREANNSDRRPCSAPAAASKSLLAICRSWVDPETVLIATQPRVELCSPPIAENRSDRVNGSSLSSFSQNNERKSKQKRKEEAMEKEGESGFQTV
jgi:hypothetical protein